MAVLRLACLSMLGGAACAATSGAQPPAAAGGADKAVAFAVHLERAQALYRVQGDAELDHPIGDSITLAGTAIPARVEKGQLELDLARDGHFKAAKGPVAVSLPKGQGDDKAKGTVKLELLITKDEKGAWRYRTLTQLSAQVGAERLAFIDVDGDGAFNHAGVDAVAWAGQTYAFPLPASGERWCTETLDLTELSFGPWGEDAKLKGRPLATAVPEALGVLKDINQQRALIGVTPRPEDLSLSAPLQKHCHYMVGTGKLAHPEDPGVAGYSDEGNAAGMNSILGQGTPAEALARQMVATFYHRQDVVRPGTLGFGVGYEGRFGGIDGRRALGGPATWPVLIPTPEQAEVPLRFQHESPDPIGGDQAAGFPITAYFGADNLVLKSWKLEALSEKAPPAAVDCYAFDSTTGGQVDFNRFQKVVGLIAKEPLRDATHYRVSLTVDAGGTAWSRTWMFATVGAKPIPAR